MLCGKNELQFEIAPISQQNLDMFIKIGDTWLKATPLQRNYACNDFGILLHIGFISHNLVNVFFKRHCLGTLQEMDVQIRFHDFHLLLKSAARLSQLLECHAFKGLNLHGMCVYVCVCVCNGSVNEISKNTLSANNKYMVFLIGKLYRLYTFFTAL